MELIPEKIKYLKNKHCKITNSLAQNLKLLYNYVMFFVYKNYAFT